ncbi:HdeD family acid-resistance protein [Isoptericola aurantiacus]|uniref:HdeD family acid-resistance protein n=1 Tax=Isoptericola aurantiacus TaxID=3377839 RepID=UPI003839D854
MSDTSTTPLSRRTVGTARRLWGLVYVRAAAYLVVGVLLFANPDEGLVWLRWLIGLVILVQGILLTLEGRAAKGADGEMSWRFVVGIISIVAAALVVLLPDLTSQVLFLVLGIWACAAGALGIVGGMRGRAARTLAWDWQLVNAAMWLVLGILVLASPTDETTTIALLLGLYLVLCGAVLVVGGLSTSTRQKDADATGPAVVPDGTDRQPGATPGATPGPTAAGVPPERPGPA